MARAKKKAVAHAPEVTESPSTAVSALPASETVSHAAERESAHEHGHAPANENSHAAQHTSHRQQGQSHADAVGKCPQRQPGYTEGFRDRLIGAHRLEHHYPFLSIVRFDEKPSEEVRKRLHEEGFSWSQENKEWKRP